MRIYIQQNIYFEEELFKLLRRKRIIKECNANSRARTEKIKKNENTMLRKYAFIFLCKKCLTYAKISLQ